MYNEAVKVTTGHLHILFTAPLRMECCLSQMLSNDVAEVSGDVAKEAEDPVNHALS